MTGRDDPAQQPGESDEAFFKRWKAHVKDRQKDGGDHVWLADSIGREVEVYCHRSPKVRGKVKAVDLRFGKVMIEGDSESVEISMSEIAQVRYPR